MRHRLSPLLPPSTLLLVALASCVGPPHAPPAPVSSTLPTPAPAPPPSPLATEWRDWPQAPGTWRYSPDPTGTRATYGAAAQGYTAALACDSRTRQLVLSIPGQGQGPLTVRTTSATRVLPTAAVTHADAWPPATIEARLAATDPLLDAVAFSRGRFVVSHPGGAPVVLPAWAEIGRVIEDCRG